MNSAQHKICSAKSNCGSHISLLLHNYFWGTVKDRSSEQASSEVRVLASNGGAKPDGARV